MPFMFFGYNVDYMILMWALLAVFALGIVAQTKVQSTFKKFSKIPASSGSSAEQAAGEMLRANNSTAVIEPVEGALTDHFNPKTNIVGLSRAVYGERSVAALAVAAHEIGHVMQYEEGYLPIRIRNAILPVASLGSQMAPWLVILGVIMGFGNLAMVGVILFAAVFIFQLITLPVEFNASRRAVAMLAGGGYLSTHEEEEGAKKVLRAASMTYVVAALASLISLLRLLVIARGSRRD